MDKNSQTLKLKDGRTLGFSEHGDLNGKPVFFMHGNPSSRFLRNADESIAKRLGVRIITPDRPGMGLSDFQPKRAALDLPDDMVQLADYLKIDKFSIFGVSAGGIYTMACAYKIPDRLDKIAMVSGAVPFNYAADPYQGMGANWKKAFVMSLKSPFWLLRFMFWLNKRMANKNPEAAYNKTLGELNEFDKSILIDPVQKPWFLSHSGEALRQGGKGVAQELKIIVNQQGWGFDPAKITKQVDLWYWEDDSLVPIQMGKYLASVLPSNTTHFMPGGGHFACIKYWEDILKSLV
jgi:pimeloyl-ACP methyl ester carboxylesterase